MNYSENNADDRLPEVNTMYQSLFNFVPDAIIVVNNKGLILQANAQAEKIFGYTGKELIGKPVDILIPERFRERHNEKMNGYMKNPRIRLMGADLELYALRKDGTEFPVDIALGHIETKDGIIVLSVVRDITEHEKMDTEIRMLLTLTQGINESKDLNTAMEIALKKVCEATGWNYGEAWVPILNGKMHVCSPVWYSTDDRLSEFRKLSEKCVFYPGTGLPGRVWLSKKTEWIPDVSDLSEVIFPRVKAARELGLKAGLGVPIICDNNVLAVLVFLMFKSQEKDSQMVEIVSAVATQLGSVISRKHAEEALRVSEEKYRRIFENAAEGIFQTSMDGRILEANPACVNLLGYVSAEELISSVTDVRKLYAEPGRRLHLVRMVKEEGSVSDFEAIIYRKDGSKIWISINAHALRDPKDKVVGLEGMVIDITHRKRAQKNFQMLMDGAPDAIIAIENNFNILFINSQTEKLFGYSKLELLGRSYDLLIPMRYREKHAAHCKGYFANPSTKIMALHLSSIARRRDGSEFPVEINMSPLETDEGTIVVIDIRDISEKKN